MIAQKIDGPRLLADWIGERTQDYMARVIGVMPSHLNHWLRGRRVPSLFYAVRISRLSDRAVPVEAWV